MDWWGRLRMRFHLRWRGGRGYVGDMSSENPHSRKVFVQGGEGALVQKALQASDVRNTCSKFVGASEHGPINGGVGLDKKPYAG